MGFYFSIGFLAAFTAVIGETCSDMVLFKLLDGMIGSSDTEVVDCAEVILEHTGVFGLTDCDCFVKVSLKQFSVFTGVEASTCGIGGSMSFEDERANCEQMVAEATIIEPDAATPAQKLAMFPSDATTAQNPAMSPLDALTTPAQQPAMALPDATTNSLAMSPSDMTANSPAMAFRRTNNKQIGSADAEVSITDLDKLCGEATSAWSPSCQGICGHGLRWHGLTCFCDKTCWLHNDCCPHFDSFCDHQGPSCEKNCGESISIDSIEGWTCSCDETCTLYDSCCPGYYDFCLGSGSYTSELTTPEPDTTPELITPEPDTTPELATPEPDTTPELTTPEPDTTPEVTTPEPDTTSTTSEPDTTSELTTSEPDSTSELTRELTPPPTSCKKRCGTRRFNFYACQCDKRCKKRDDCCYDFYDRCEDN